MGHARYEDLRDLEKVLAAVRTWPGISEPTKGIFYLRRKPFLHFHVKDGARWADAVVGKRDTDPFELRSTREGEVPSRGSNPLWSLRRREDKGMRTTRTGLASLALSTLAVLAAVPCLALMMR
jgi:hypothetical protein